MKPLKEDQQLGSVSRLYSVTLQALKPKSSPRRRRSLDVSNHRGLTERSGEVFSLDILSHRMSENGHVSTAWRTDRELTYRSVELWVMQVEQQELH